MVSSYQKLKKKVQLLERDLYMKNLIIAGTHEMLDKMDAPRSKMDAHPGHRLFWYQEGKRESYKTKENTEGYHPNVWEEKKKKLIEVQTPPQKKKKKKSYSHKLNVLGDDL